MVPSLATMADVSLSVNDDSDNGLSADEEEEEENLQVSTLSRLLTLL